MSGLVSTAALAVLAVLLLYGAHWALVPWRSVLDTLPYHSGELPQAHALSRYHVRWYLATLLFLAFDVEMLFMYPWAVVVADLGASAVTEMFVFLGALLVAVAWAWREGALRWV
jgi:NADH:ubiquinone oxidoreductase subunit 3 (subunit A)